MAKKKQKKDKESKPKKSGSKAAKLPKTIAGVKVPKELRESGGRLLEAAKNPLVMELAAAAMIAAAAGLREGRSRSVSKSADAAGAAGRRAAAQGQDIGSVLLSTALDGLRQIADSARAPRASGSDEDEDKGSDERPRRPRAGRRP